MKSNDPYKNQLTSLHLAWFLYNHPRSYFYFRQFFTKSFVKQLPWNIQSDPWVALGAKSIKVIQRPWGEKKISHLFSYGKKTDSFVRNFISPHKFVPGSRGAHLWNRYPQKDIACRPRQPIQVQLVHMECRRLGAQSRGQGSSQRNGSQQARCLSKRNHNPVRNPSQRFLYLTGTIVFRA